MPLDHIRGVEEFLFWVLMVSSIVGALGLLICWAESRK